MEDKKICNITSINLENKNYLIQLNKKRIGVKWNASSCNKKRKSI